MIRELDQEYAGFQALLEKHYEKSSGSESLQKMKSKTWEHFLKIGLPTKRTEVFRYLKLRNLFSQPYEIAQAPTLSPETIAPYIYPECRQSVLVLVNGQYQPALSNVTGVSNRVVITPLEEALRTYGTFLNNQWTKSLKEESDPFVLINGALHHNGIFVYLPPKTIVETPIQILHVIDAGDKPVLLHPRFHLFAGAHSQASFASSIAIISGSQYCLNQTAEFSIEEDAHINYTQTPWGHEPKAWVFDAVRAQLKRNSTLRTVCVTNGSATVRNDYRVTLTGENSEVSLNGLWMLSDKNEFHSNILIEHQAPHCRSNQLFKGVLNDFSRSSFEGKILVRQAAQKTEAFQLNNNLLLSDRANADSKPNLEIFADDVKASHGATVGQLDNDLIFYLNARGLTEDEAKDILVHSYCKEVLDLINIPSLASKMDGQMRKQKLKQ